MHYITKDNDGLITGRYLTDVHGDNIPDDALEVTEDIFNASIQMQHPALVNGELVELPPEAPTPEQLAEQAKAEAHAYLASTDWYVTRMTETGVAIPEDVLTKRAECRVLL
jgi:hypothetical protein